MISKRKNWLIATNGLVWMAAGFNIARIGISCAFTRGGLVWLWFIPVFIAFGAMFIRVISKNTTRIQAMPDERPPFYKFLSLKGYLIIAFMMTLGITLRSLGTIPDGFFAFFYTGLGSALFLAGLRSIVLLLLTSRH